MRYHGAARSCKILEDKLCQPAASNGPSRDGLPISLSDEEFDDCLAVAFLSRLKCISEQEELADSLQQGPLLVAADAANEQHYEVPPEFFQAVLGVSPEIQLRSLARSRHNVG